MRLEQTLSTKHLQTLQLSTQMLQSLEILSLPILDLQQRINAELEANPALERAQESREASIEEAFEEFDTIESALEGEEWADTTVLTATKELGSIMERTASSEHQTLHHALLEQLGLHQLADAEYQCGQMVINNLDTNGFHIIDPREHPQLAGHPYGEKMIALIQTFEPRGVGVSNVPESLGLQARLRGDAPPHTQEILARYFVELEKRKFSKIAAALQIVMESVSAVYDYIRTLTPYPGRTINTQQAQFIIPDLEIRFNNNSYQVAINEQAYPKLRINTLFLKIEETGNNKDNQFVKSYRQQAQAFMGALQRRNRTLLRTAYALLHKQHQFFRLGPQHLQPLRLQDIASMLKVHETTVSRIASRKYVQTNWGVYPISYLFSNRVGSDEQPGSARHSKESIKATIQEILMDRKHKEETLSDQQVTNILQQKGVQIARRTVTKYRNELNIPNAIYRSYQTDTLQ